MNTGLRDKNGTEIKIGDRTRLVLPSGEVREFEVCFKTVKRTTVKTLPGFEPETAEVSITGIVFCWNGHDLFPCVDEEGVSDVEKMEVIKTTTGKEAVSRLFRKALKKPGFYPGKRACMGY